MDEGDGHGRDHQPYDLGKEEVIVNDQLFKVQ